MYIYFNTQECKAGSIFKDSQAPPPTSYNPSYNKYKSLHFSLGKRLKTEDKEKASVPGPIYNIESTMLDKNKNLSIYVRRNSTKICPERTCYPRKTAKDMSWVSQSKARCPSENSFITRKGGKVLGQTGPFPKQSREKRLFQREEKNDNPGPGYYSSFSSFIDDNVEVF